MILLRALAGLIFIASAIGAQDARWDGKRFEAALLPVPMLAHNVRSLHNVLRELKLNKTPGSEVVQRIRVETSKRFAALLRAGKRYQLPRRCVAQMTNTRYHEPPAGSDDRPRLDYVTFAIVCHSPGSRGIGMLELELTADEKVETLLHNRNIPVVGGGSFSKVTQMYMSSLEYSQLIRDGVLTNLEFEVATRDDVHTRWQPLSQKDFGENVLTIYGRLLQVGNRAY